MLIINKYKVGCLLFLGFFLGYGYFALDIHLDFWAEEESFHARTFPYLIALAGIVIALLLLMLPGAPNAESESSLRVVPAALLLVLTGCYALLLDYFGFAISSVLFLILGSVTLGERHPLKLGATVLLVAVFWLLMDSLGIYLSPGEMIGELG